MIYQNQKIDWPLDSNLIRRKAKANTFGMVRHYPDGRPKPHQGIDLHAPHGSPCYAIADGKVAFAGIRGDFGLMIVIKLNGTDKYAAYAHLSAIEVQVGDHVELGEMIGKTGCTGNATGMKGEDQHLHFEIRTVALPGLGLEGRVDPIELYGCLPVTEAIKREGVTRCLESN